MLRITVIGNSDAAKAYFKSADYYVEGHEEPAHWHGKAAEMLGLTGPVAYKDFESLCDNQHPTTGKRITVKHLENRRVGYDFTFSVPKSVSIAYALGDDHRIADAFRGAVADTMGELEQEIETRVRKGGAFENRQVGNMAWVDFLHKTSRPIKGQPDPQLHIHAVAFNTVFDPVEQQWKAGEFAHVKSNAAYFQAAFRARLANRLQDLGYEVRRNGKDDFELVGIGERPVQEFSRRTALIEKVAKQLGITRPETKEKLGATTREKKTKGLTWDDLQRLWKERLQPGEYNGILNTVIRSHREPATPVLDNRAALDWAVLHAFERDSVVSERELATVALKHGLGTVEPDGILADLKAHPGLIRRDGKVTTNEVLAEERQVLDYAIEGRGRFKPLGRRDAALAEYLSPSQSAAVKHIWTSPDRLILVRGVAGVGKTTLLKAALAGIDKPSVVLAPSAEASRDVLRREGFGENADTLARFLMDEEFQAQAKGGLIVLDEASLAGAKDVARLSKLADSLDARVLLLGDQRQHKAVSRGDTLALLEDRAGLPVMEVSEIRRQSGDYKKAVEALARGDVATGFNRLDEMGWVTEGAHDQIAIDYLQALKDDKSVLIVSPTHAEGDAITATLREKLKDEGRLGKDEREFQALVPLHLTEAERGDASSYQPGMVAQFHRAGGGFRAGTRVPVQAGNVSALASSAAKHSLYRVAPLQLAIGDAVRVTGNGKDITGKHRLNNGAVYTVDGFDPKGNIRLGNGWTIGADFGYLDHGYVSTSHASQGRTVDRVLVSVNPESFPAAGAEQFYVSVSRGRQQATIYTSDREGLREVIQQEDKRMLAHDLVGKPKPKKRKLKDRIRKHLAFLRQSVNFSREPGRDVSRPQDRGMGYER